jgi:hypothetical protein
VSFTCAELLQIIAACSQQNVTRFKAGDVDVTFTGYRNPDVPVSQTDELRQLLENDKAWLEQTPPPPAYPDEVE